VYHKAHTGCHTISSVLQVRQLLVVRTMDRYQWPSIQALNPPPPLRHQPSFTFPFLFYFNFYGSFYCTVESGTHYAGVTSTDGGTNQSTLRASDRELFPGLATRPRGSSRGRLGKGRPDLTRPDQTRPDYGQNWMPCIHFENYGPMGSGDRWLT
jgi:hypothetical protein